MKSSKLSLKNKIIHGIIAIPISVLNLIADQVLYFTEDRKIMKSGTLL